MNTPIYFDAEFTGLHVNTTLISIGLISESGAFFYAEFNDYDKTQVDEWIDEHVIKNLLYNDKEFVISPLDESFTFKFFDEYHFSTIVKASREEVKERLLSWLANEAKVTGNRLTFYTDCYAYDWVLLNDLICENGEALNLPDYINYIPIDLSTYMYYSGIDPDINREEYVGDHLISIVKSEPMFKLPDFSDSADIKHNSLWDAVVIRYCFAKIAYESIPVDIRHYKYNTPLMISKKPVMGIDVGKLIIANEEVKTNEER